MRKKLIDCGKLGTTKSDNNTIDKALDEMNVSKKKKSLIKNQITYALSRTRMKSTTQVDFTLDINRIPLDYMRGDIRVDSARSLLFVTQSQQRELICSSVIYMDPRVSDDIPSPFAELMTFRGHLENGNGVGGHLMTFADAAMTRAEPRDIVAVWRRMEQLCSGINLKWIFVDFERNDLPALTQALPELEFRACLYHYSQVYVRHIISNL